MNKWKALIKDFKKKLLNQSSNKKIKESLKI